MKSIILRTGLILLAAAVICAALYLYTASAPLSQGNGAGYGGGGARNQVAAADGVERSAYDSRGHGQGRGQYAREGAEPGLAALELLAQAGKIAIITLAVLAIQALLRRLRRNQITPAAPQ